MANLGKKRDREELPEETINLEKFNNEVEETQVMFLLAELKEDHFHLMKEYVRNYLDGKSFEVSEMVDSLIGNASKIGNVIKTVIEDDEEEPEEEEEEDSEQNEQQDDLDEGIFGVASFLNFEGKFKFEEQMKEYLISKAGKSASKLKKLFEKKIGLFVSERAVNVPDQIVPGIFTCLKDEIESYASCEYVLVISKYVLEGKKKLYYKDEDTKLAEKAVLTFDYTVPMSEEAKMNMEQTYKTVALVPLKHFKKAFNAII